MLSGRDEPQPQGYLWLEVAKGDSYLNFGCGIRANRAPASLPGLRDRRLADSWRLVQPAIAKTLAFPRTGV